MTYVSTQLRQLTIERANGCCEYCRIPQDFDAVSFHIEHIIASSHGGHTVENNLALSCSRCNLYKGTNIATADPETGEPTFLFHPRRQKWDEHFRLNGAVIQALTPEGRATIFVLHINDQERVEHRELLIQFDNYPCD